MGQRGSSVPAIKRSRMVGYQQNITSVANLETAYPAANYPEYFGWVSDGTTGYLYVSKHVAGVYTWGAVGGAGGGDYYDYIDETGVAGTAVSITTGLTVGIGADLTIIDSGGGLQKWEGTVAVNSSAAIYSDGTDTCTLAISAAGAMTLQRTGGTATFQVSGIYSFK